MIYQHINLEYLFTASQKLNFIFKMFAAFRVEAPQIITNIQQAIAEKNLVQLAKVVHKAKSTMGVLGCTNLVKQAAEIEKMCANNPDIISLLDKIDTFVEGCKLSLIELDDAEKQLKENN